MLPAISLNIPSHFIFSSIFQKIATYGSLHFSLGFTLSYHAGSILHSIGLYLKWLSPFLAALRCEYVEHEVNKSLRQKPEALFEFSVIHFDFLAHFCHRQERLEKKSSSLQLLLSVRNLSVLLNNHVYQTIFFDIA